MMETALTYIANQMKLNPLSDSIKDIVNDRFDDYKSKIQLYKNELFNSGKYPAVNFLQSAMATPFFVLSNSDNARNVAQQVARTTNFNSICGLIDLQDGRDYIVRGRNQVELHETTRTNINICIQEGVRPLIIIRNDWAARTTSLFVPSFGGFPTNDTFYTDELLIQEKLFLENFISEFGETVDIQLNIEPNDSRSANFAAELAETARSVGYQSRLIVNPLGAALTAHLTIKSRFDDSGVIFSRSRNNADLGPDPIINTDGNLNINSTNVATEWMPPIRADGRPYIIWSLELSRTNGSIHDNYLGPPLYIVPPDIDDGCEVLPYPPSVFTRGCLWKPVSESNGKLIVLVNTGFRKHIHSLKIFRNTTNEFLEDGTFATDTANGCRPHYRFTKPGSQYGSDIRVELNLLNGVVFNHVVPNGASRHEW